MKYQNYSHRFISSLTTLLAVILFGGSLFLYTLSTSPLFAQIPMPESQQQALFGGGTQIEHFQLEGVPYLVFYQGITKISTVWKWDTSTQSWIKADNQHQLPSQVWEK